ncbi:unnamed protein product, partial [Discosporangium mesarthrocarpum]
MGIILRSCAWSFGLCLAVRLLASLRKWWTRRLYGISREATVVAFFHPYCNAGGGGERVLWRAVHALGRLSKDRGGRSIHVIIYTGDVEVSPEDIIAKVRRQFHIPIRDTVAFPISFVYLRGRWLLDPAKYPVLTLIGQSVGSFILALEALVRATPDIFMDTTGCAFSFPAAWAFGCRVGAYVHYPTISTDMLSRVRDRRPAYNNRGWISSRLAVSNVKLAYYHAFAFLYGLTGSFADVVMVNSNWTRRHIEMMWCWRWGWSCSALAVVFPPCDTSELESLPLNNMGRQRCIVSVGQFRPEKDQALQVQALSALLSFGRDAEGAGGKGHGDGERTAREFRDVRLVLVGSCRGPTDWEVVNGVKALAEELGVSGNVEVVVNCSFEELKEWLGRASVGIHTMWNEHFGIGVVEMMASGLVTIAHRSGGPQTDIVIPLPDGEVTGFLADTPNEYASIMAAVLRNSSPPELSPSKNTEEDGLGCVGGGGRHAVEDVASAAAGTGRVKFTGQEREINGGVCPDSIDLPVGSGCPGGCVDVLAVRRAGRESARRFSNTAFDIGFSESFSRLLQQHQKGHYG